MILTIRYQGGNQLYEIANWLAEHIGGPVTKLRGGGVCGPGWAVYHVSSMQQITDDPFPLPFLHTKAKIDDPDIATMFLLRWA